MCGLCGSADAGVEREVEQTRARRALNGASATPALVFLSAALTTSARDSEHATHTKGRSAVKQHRT
jgi:hypothetical protein